MVLVNSLISMSSMVWLFFLDTETFPLEFDPEGVPVWVPPVMLFGDINGDGACVWLLCWFAGIPRIGDSELKCGLV